ncbi:MAG: prepilin-type N-terminal cleavage/methylation domain-containing protein [Epsilonproteobacteria bacterium]|nr:prepilin-type N-terminal cleavage/methylation domain-containing protein [Campylobacterota bacterium]
MSSKRKAFTLMEVMIATLIVSVVIAALLQMRGDSNYQLQRVEQHSLKNFQLSFLLGVGEKYGFEKERVTLDKFVDDFDIQSDLKRSLRSHSMDLKYEKVNSIELPSGGALEMGVDKIKLPDYTATMMRVRLQ